ncbi:hypothetical protein GCM10009092_35260 [Bowmanella denitrificans]|uniref:Uncharacterized protein n=1 Tax=Bowmanella denitrificans TaxID=366582 RepID=A0ABN0XME6_9ALTE
MDNWQQSCPAQVFCFSHPSSWQNQQASIVDSTAGMLTGDNLVMRYDYGINADNFSRLKQARRKAMEIDGYQAEMLIDGNLVALYVGKVQYVDVMQNYMALSMSLEFSAQVNLELAEKVFNSVHFNPPNS